MIKPKSENLKLQAEYQIDAYIVSLQPIVELMDSFRQLNFERCSNEEIRCDSQLLLPDFKHIESIVALKNIRQSELEYFVELKNAALKFKILRTFEDDIYWDMRLFQPDSTKILTIAFLVTLRLFYQCLQKIATDNHKLGTANLSAAGTYKPIVLDSATLVQSRRFYSYALKCFNEDSQIKSAIARKTDLGQYLREITIALETNPKSYAKNILYNLGLEKDSPTWKMLSKYIVGKQKTLKNKQI